MKKGIFVTDALFNHGISGSPVFAIRDGIPNFELVGIASSSAAQASNILVPDEDFKITNKLRAPYNGEIFVENNFQQFSNISLHSNENHVHSRKIA